MQNKLKITTLSLCVFGAVYGGKDGIGSDHGKNAGTALGKSFEEGAKTLDLPGTSKNIKDASKGFGSEAASKFQAIAEGAKAAGAVGLAVGVAGVVAHEVYDRQYPESVTKLNRFKADRERENLQTVDTLLGKFQRCFRKNIQQPRNQLGIPAYCTKRALDLFLLGQRPQVAEIVRSFEDFDDRDVYKASPAQAQQEYAQCLKDNAAGPMKKLPSEEPHSHIVLEVPERCEHAQMVSGLLSSTRTMQTYVEFLRQKYPDINFREGEFRSRKYVTTWRNDKGEKPGVNCTVNVNLAE